MPYFPILQKPTQNNLITKTSFRQDAPPRRGATALFHNPVCKAQRSVPGFSSTPTSACRRYATSPPPIVLRIHIVRHHPSDCAIGEKTAEERFNMLARGWLAYPVTPIHSLLPPKSGCIRQHMVGLHSLVAERRHSSITRYAKRSVACRDSPRHQTLRAGGTPLPHLRRLPPPSSAIHRYAPEAHYSS